MVQGGFARHSSFVTRHYSQFFLLGLLATSLLAASVAQGDSRGKPTLEAIGNEVQLLIKKLRTAKMRPPFSRIFPSATACRR